jgi:hypothetical protein
MYGISATVARLGGGEPWTYNPVRTGQIRRTDRELAVMELLVFAAFFVVLAVLSALGWVADSRDGADWTPTDNGFRRPRGI